MKFKIFTLTILISVTASHGATTVVYDFGARVGEGALLSTDGWQGSDITNWVNAGGTARNNNDGDDRIYRLNDSGFSYTVAPGTNFLTLEVAARGSNIAQSNLMEVTFGNNATQISGFGFDYGNTSKFYLLNANVRTYESGASLGGDATYNIKVVYDLVNHTADLSVNGILKIDDAAMNVDFSTANSLRVRAIQRYAGPKTITITTETITTVPEPTSLALLGLGALAACVRRSRK